METTEIREARLQEDMTIAQHFFQLWQDNQVPEESIQANWQEIVLDFLSNARDSLQFKSFVAVIDEQIVGSISCQLFSGLYPLVLTEKHRKYGYIWNVYIEPEYRYRGIATTLTQHACAYLKSLGCTQAILHASPYGKPLYTKLGFVESNEMRLDLNE